MPYATVGRNCSIYVKKLINLAARKYQKQIDKSDAEIWRHLLKYNQHEMYNKSSRILG